MEEIREAQDKPDNIKEMNVLRKKLYEAEMSIHKYGTISADELELELGI